MAYDMYGDSEEQLTNQEKAAILFIALGPEYSAKLFQHLDDDEAIGVERWELKDLEEMIYAGKLTDSKTVAAIMAYARKYGR